MLTGAILCFPSNWTLAEKIGHAGSRASTCRSSRYDETDARGGCSGSFDLLQARRRR